MRTTRWVLPVLSLFMLAGCEVWQAIWHGDEPDPVVTVNETAPDAKPPYTVANPETTRPTEYTVQVTVFANLADANAFLNGLGSEFPSYIELVDVNGAAMSKAMVGPFWSREEAELVRDQLSARDDVPGIPMILSAEAVGYSPINPSSDQYAYTTTTETNTTTVVQQQSDDKPAVTETDRQPERVPERVPERTIERVPERRESEPAPATEAYIKLYTSMPEGEAFGHAMADGSVTALVMFRNIYPQSQMGPYVEQRIQELQNGNSSTAVAAAAETVEDPNYPRVDSLPAQDQALLARIGYGGTNIDLATLDILRGMNPVSQNSDITLSGTVTVPQNVVTGPGSIIAGNTTIDTDITSVVTIGDDFSEGRIVHHAPSEMVQDQTYFLELAIHPLTADTTIEVVDLVLSESVGTGLAPGSEQPVLERQFDTVRASELMAAEIISTDFEITSLTDEIQPLFAGEPTIWKWQVKAGKSGDLNLSFSLDKVVTVSGREVNKNVTAIPLSIKVQSIDELLGDPDDMAELVAASAPAPSRASPLTTTLAPPASAQQSRVAAAPSEGGCSLMAGDDPDRHALLLTNLTYNAPISTLSETHADGERLTASLNAVGFNVTHCRDLGQRDTVRALSQLGRTAKARKDEGAEPVTFFYYSGHGANVGGVNYVLPVDLDGASPTDLQDGGVKFEDIFNRVSGQVAPLSFVVFDACRTVMDNQSRGLIRTYEPVGWASGVFQAFATQPGKTAADDGLYSASLAEMMTTVAAPANVLFKRVQDRVAQKTGDSQNPSYIDRTTGGDFYFKAG